MIRPCYIPVLCLLLSACEGASVTSMQDGAKQITEGSQQNYQALKKDVTDMFTYKTPKAPKPVPPTYCYRVMQDIMCYREAVAGARDRLVGYQGSVVDEPAPKQAAADAPVQQADAAPVTPVAATSSDTPPSPLASAAEPTPLTVSGDEKEKAEKSMEHFDGQKPVTVGSEPPVAASGG